MKPISDPYIRIGSITVLTAKQAAAQTKTKYSLHRYMYHTTNSNTSTTSTSPNSACLELARWHTSNQSASSLPKSEKAPETQ